jgi:hypothetical protein
MKIIITESRLKQLIFKKLSEDLSNAEIIPCKDSIWFIDREKKYWYFQYEKSGILNWRYEFFSNFFNMFSLERNEYELILAEWVEEVLNRKVGITQFKFVFNKELEDVLNCKVNATRGIVHLTQRRVEKVLNQNN